MTGADIVSAARKLRGVRWRHQGRSLDGVDCIGLVVLARASLGLSTLDVTDYARRASNEAMLSYCREHMREVTLDDIELGDVLVMRFDSDRHMAVVADYPGGGLSIVHSHLPNKRVTENRLDQHFLSRVVGCFRMPEVSP
ncbi:hypothetical protein CY658_05090 [Variovorax sp. RO1]|uniref:C40 family peptidase n=1 Tax=Variovorax sp. RO1 TaxID=2066034 RepID=UPI000C717C77|nr:NlpC/P60 family protein [Variovorax sp. RO1]PLC06410.1 hypothetical protein CY658_05090 [Variovorax sp. RO1]